MTLRCECGNTKTEIAVGIFGDRRYPRVVSSKAKQPDLIIPCSRCGGRAVKFTKRPPREGIDSSLVLA